MTSPLKEQIERVGREIERTENELAEEIRKAESDDGEITREDEEYEDIQQLRKELKEARRLHKAKEDEFNANRAEWQGLAGAVSELKGKFAGLVEFGIAGVDGLRQAVEGAEAAARDERFREACDEFGAAQTSAQEPLEEYERQSEAKTTYDTEKPVIDTALQGFRDAGVTSDTLTSAIGQIETNLSSSEGSADGNDYVEALSLLRLGNPEVTRAETEMTRLTTEKETAEAELGALRTKLAETETEAAEFEALVTRLEAIPGGIIDAERMITESDFATVHGHISTLDYELDAIKSAVPILRAEQEAEAARIEAERQLWDQAQPRWTEVQEHVRELTEWEDAASAQLEGMVATVQGHEDAEEYQLALDALSQAEQATVEPWRQHQEQVTAQTTYDSERSGLDQRVSQAGTNEYLDDPASQQLSQIETTLTRMSDLAGGKDYVAANDETQGVSAALDTLEQLLRENQALAEAAAALGEDPNTSNADVEAEANRMLYEEERGLLQGRIDEANASDVRGADIVSALGQLETNMISIQATADGGDFAQALQDIRGETTEMGRIEEMIRDQAELKAQYETALADLQQEATRLGQSELMTVSDAAGHIVNSIPTAQAKADEGQYQEALTDVQGWQTELDSTEREGAELAAKKAEVETSLAALRPRLDAAAANEYPEIQPAANVVVDAEAQINGLVEREDFEGALAQIPDLTELLELYEIEAESQHGYQRYQDALATLGIDAKIMDMRASIYPETEEEQAEVEAADSTRTGHESSGEWADARTAAYDESEKLGLFTTEETRIASAKTSYESVAPALIAGAEEVSTEGQEDETGIIASWETTLVGIRARMETAADDNRWLEALEIAGEYQQSLSEAEIAVRDLFQATDSDINDYVSTKTALVKVAIVSAMMDGVSRFEVWVLARIEAERTVGAVARYTGYGVDVISIIGNFDPTGITGAIAGTAKLALDIAADELDNREDDADATVGRQLCTEIRAQMAGLEGMLNDDIGPWIKSNNLDAYKEIGNRMYHNDRSAANAVLEGIGVRAGGMTGLSEALYQDLIGKFQVIRE